MKEDKIFISSQCVSEMLGKELIILDINSGLYHSLNKIGSLIWEEIEKSNPSFSQLKQNLKKKYNNTEIEIDLEIFVKKLLKEKLIYLK